jgi:hypothetical protein
LLLHGKKLIVVFNFKAILECEVEIQKKKQDFSILSLPHSVRKNIYYRTACDKISRYVLEMRGINEMYRTVVIF